MQYTVSREGVSRAKSKAAPKLFIIENSSEVFVVQVGMADHPLGMHRRLGRL
jgi:hypothetical protein